MFAIEVCVRDGDTTSGWLPVYHTEDGPAAARYLRDLTLRGEREGQRYQLVYREPAVLTSRRPCRLH